MARYPDMLHRAHRIVLWLESLHISVTKYFMASALKELLLSLKNKTKNIYHEIGIKQIFALYE